MRFFQKHRITKLVGRFIIVALIPLSFAALSDAQDWVKGGVGLAAQKIRLAVPDFKASSQDPKNTELLKTFNDTLWTISKMPAFSTWRRRVFIR